MRNREIDVMQVLRLYAQHAHGPGDHRHVSRSFQPSEMTACHLTNAEQVNPFANQATSGVPIAALLNLWLSTPDAESHLRPGANEDTTRAANCSGCTETKGLRNGARPNRFS
jgi:hypothetical protein